MPSNSTRGGDASIDHLSSVVTVVRGRQSPDRSGLAIRTAPSPSMWLGAARRPQKKRCNRKMGLAALLLEHFGGVGDVVNIAGNHDPRRPVLLAAKVRLDDPIDVRPDVGA